MTSSASTEDLEKVHLGLSSIDFHSFTDYYKNKRSSRVEENLVQLGLLVEESQPPGLNHLDDVLHSALEVAQELLTDATSAALVRAEHTLNLRLRGLIRAGADEVNGGEEAPAVHPVYPGKRIESQMCCWPFGSSLLNEFSAREG